MGSGRGKQREQQLERQADTASTAAAAPTPFETFLNTRNMNLLTGLDSGKDVSQITELSPYLNLFNAASRDNPHEAGQGLLGNNLLSGSNGKLATLVGEQEHSRRQEQAAGDLYNSVQEARGAAEQGGQWGASMDQTRRDRAADRANDRYTSYLNRPKKPSFWEQLALGGLQAGASLGAAAI